MKLNISVVAVFVIKWEMDRMAERISEKKGDQKESEWNILGVGWRAG